VLRPCPYAEHLQCQANPRAGYENRAVGARPSSKCAVGAAYEPPYIALRSAPHAPAVQSQAAVQVFEIVPVDQKSRIIFCSSTRRRGYSCASVSKLNPSLLSGGTLSGFSSTTTIALFVELVTGADSPYGVTIDVDSRSAPIERAWK